MERKREKTEKRMRRRQREGCRERESKNEEKRSGGEKTFQKRKRTRSKLVGSYACVIFMGQQSIIWIHLLLIVFVWTVLRMLQTMWWNTLTKQTAREKKPNPSVVVFYANSSKNVTEWSWAVATMITRNTLMPFDLCAPINCPFGHKFIGIAKHKCAHMTFMSLDKQCRCLCAMKLWSRPLFWRLPTMCNVRASSGVRQIQFTVQRYR